MLRIQNIVFLITKLALEESDLTISFDVVNLFPSVHVDKTKHWKGSSVKGILNKRTNFPVGSSFIVTIELLPLCISSLFIKFQE